jgi:predicted permease
MPPGFDFPSGVAAWIPRELDPPSPSRTGHNWEVVGRVRDGITVALAHANLSAIARRIRHQYGTEVDLSDVAVVTLAETIVGDVRMALHVAGLLLAHTAARRKELAIRAALGARRGRLMQQFLVESFVFSLAAGIAGGLMAAGGILLLPVILPADLPRQEGIAINPAVLLFGLAVTVMVAAALGLFAAWRAGRGDLRDALNAGSRSHAGSSASQRLRSVLVVGEVAITLVILVGAGLLGRSFLRLISTSPVFRQENLITMEFSPPIPHGQEGMDQGAIARQVHLLDSIVARLSVIPGTEGLGLAGAVPVAAGDNLPEGNFLVLNGQSPPANFDEFGRMAQNHSQTGHALYAVASEGYFKTLDIPLIRGRVFKDQDTLNSPNGAVISQALARRRWLNQDPIGQTIEFGNIDGNPKPLTIIGIVGDVRARGLDAPPDSVIYVDYRQRGMNLNSTPTILLRTTAPEGEIIAPAREIFHKLAPEFPSNSPPSPSKWAVGLPIVAFFYFSWDSSPPRLSCSRPSVSTAWSLFLSRAAPRRSGFVWRLVRSAVMFCV